METPISQLVFNGYIRFMRDTVLSTAPPSRLDVLMLKFNGNPTTLRQSNVATGHPLKMRVSIGKSPINSVFSIAMFDDTGWWNS